MTGPVRFFTHPEEATFIERPNRFVVRCRRGGEEIAAFLPNPGRLQELLLPGRRLWLSGDGRSPSRKHLYTVVAVEREGRPIMVHTHRTNSVARYLIEEDRIPGLKGARVAAQEVQVGRSRLDFLLVRKGKEIFLEVKSCTLIGKGLAMFPDAVTERGARHLRELAELADQGRETAILFLVHWPQVEYFLPDYHTDLYFARTMLEVKGRVRFYPVAVAWQEDLSLGRTTRLLTIPWELLEREAKDRGSYLVVLKVEEEKQINVGKGGRFRFPPGYYIYVGSAMRHLTARLARHRRLRKRSHWHMDDLRQEAEWHGALPIRASERLECLLAEALGRIAEWVVPGFGCSDCSCSSHLFGMSDDPWKREAFIALVQHFRMDRLLPLPKR